LEQGVLVRIATQRRGDAKDVERKLAAAMARLIAAIHVALLGSGNAERVVTKRKLDGARTDR
jgi:hypothetical protein